MLAIIAVAVQTAFAVDLENAARRDGEARVIPAKGNLRVIGNVVTQRLERRGHAQGFDTRAGKGIVPDGDEPLVKDDSRKPAAAEERPLANDAQVAWRHEALESRIGERVILDRGDGIGQVDSVELRAVCERLLLDDLAALRHRVSFASKCQNAQMRALVCEDGLPVGLYVGILIVDANLLECSLREEPRRKVIGAKPDDKGAQPTLIEYARGDTCEHAGKDEFCELATPANPRRIVRLDVARQSQPLEIAARAKRAIADSLDLRRADDLPHRIQVRARVDGKFGNRLALDKRRNLERFCIRLAADDAHVLVVHGHVFPKRAVIQHKRTLFRARSLILADKTRPLVAITRNDLLHALDFLDASQSVAQSHGRHLLDSCEILVVIRIEAAMRDRHLSTPTHL